ncbi:MAG: HD domain-containing protein [Clostridia bacterium]|nr:HD domain-containing protein [Clostridia bacterium]MDD4375447.1 HD domain-containing protein [Clostridia bacterium]
MKEKALDYNDNKNIELNFFDIIMCFSDAVDLISKKMSGHHIRVAYIAYRLALQYRLPKKRIINLVIAACVHDIGALTIEERDNIISPDYKSDEVHEKIGYSYLKSSKHFRSIALFVKHHHIAWDFGNGKYYKDKLLPIECHILCLADRIDAYIDKDTYILLQADNIISKVIENSGKLFMPDVVATFINISDKEDFWLYTVSHSIHEIVGKLVDSANILISLDEFEKLAKWFSNIIDFRSRFTSVHSRGVSASAEAIASKLELPAYEIKNIRIAGYIHDLGKLAVPNEILEKNDKLNFNEYAIIKSHTFHTYNVLRRLKDINNIVSYGSYHHEHIDGSGYPFHLKGKDLSQGARILAVADVFTAITEDRPYRKAMGKDSVIDVLNDMKNNKLLDSKIVNLTIKHFDEINKFRNKKQALAKKEYELFWQQASK